MKNKKRILVTIIISFLFLALIGLSITDALTESFALECISYIYRRLLMNSLAVYVIYKCFKKELSKSMKNVLILCSASFLIDAILSSVRFILSQGINMVLFFPVSIPFAFITIMYYACKDNNRSSKERNSAIAIGIVLLLISIFFEVYSFVDIL